MGPVGRWTPCLTQSPDARRARCHPVQVFEGNAPKQRQKALWWWISLARVVTGMTLMLFALTSAYWCLLARPGSGRDGLPRPGPLFGAECEGGAGAGSPAGRAECAGDRDQQAGQGEQDKLPRLVHRQQ